MKVRFYNTPNSWWYFGIDYNKKHGWFSVSFLTKQISLYWGKNTEYIP